MANTSAQDEVFGLPFLFTGGLPNSLEKFTEGNLRCFLIYLIEVVGKANRQNVWLKPAWWKSKLIPYSPISVDTSKVPKEEVVKELRSLIENCYKFYNAEKILEVSKQLAEIPRILLSVRDNLNNTMTVYDTNSKAVYVTVRPENLYYDEKSLEKVSKDWRSNYTEEDVTFCEIKKASKEEKTMSSRASSKGNFVIEVIDSDDDEATGVNSKTELKNESQNKKNSKSPNVNKFNAGESLFKSSKKSSRGIVLKEGNDLVIALSDSDDEFCKTKPNNPPKDDERISTPTSSPQKIYNSRSRTKVKRSRLKFDSMNEEDVQFVCEYNFTGPCPKRFKKQMPEDEMPNVIILTDSDDNEDSGICISSYTSLATNYSNLMFLPESPNKNIQKSILGPLIHSPNKSSQDLPKISGLLYTPNKQNGTNSSKSSNLARIPRQIPAKVLPQKGSHKVYSTDSEEDIHVPTKEELFLLRRKKNRAYYPPPLNDTYTHKESTEIKINSQFEFMALFKMQSVDPEKSIVKDVKSPNSAKAPLCVEFLTALRSLKGSSSRMPLDWIKILSSNNIILSTRSSRTKRFDPTYINYESNCSTNPDFVAYSIKLSKKAWPKEGRSDSRQTSRRERNGNSIEKWLYQSEESSQRGKRAALRIIRSLTTGDHRISPLNTLMIGTLVPTLHRLPTAIFERALYSSIKLKPFF